jgi:hypothetical protein
MTVLRCSQKLLKRLKQPAAPPEPAAQDNPLGEWYGDVFFHRREPFVLLLNADTCAALVLPGRADDLRMLGKHAEYQLAMLLGTAGIGTLDAVREAVAWREPIVFARTASRSLIALMNQRKYEAWMQFEHGGLSPIITAARLWETPFKRQGARDYAYATALLRARLLPSAIVVQLDPSSTRQ